jgi:hypothetical protein
LVKITMVMMMSWFVFNVMEYINGMWSKVLTSSLWNLLCWCNVLRWIRCLCDVTLSVAYIHTG